MSRALPLLLAVALALGAAATAGAAEPDIAETCLRNYDFAFGTDFWSAYKYNVKPGNALKWQEPVALTEENAGKPRHFLRIGAWSCLQTMMMRIAPGQAYTVTVVARSAAVGKKTAVPVYLIDGVWHIKAVTANLGDGWEKVTFQQTFPFSKQARAYFRIDVKDVPVDVASVCVVKGEAPEALPKPMDVRLGFVGKRCFSAEEPGNALNLKAIVSEKAKLPLEVTVTSRDLWGRDVFARKVVIDKAGESVIPLAIPNAPKGTFVCEAAGGGAKGDCRYAVLPPTAGKELPFHALCGHFQLFEQPDRAPYDRFMTFKRNRFFPGNDYQFLGSDAAREVYRRSGYENIVNLTPESDPKLKEMLKERADIPEQAVKDFEEYLRRIVPALNVEGVYGVEIFNEPYLWYFGPKRETAVPPEKLAKLLEIAYPIMRELAPKVKIVQQISLLNDQDFERFVKAGGYRHIDVLALHPYSVRPDIMETYRHFTEKRALLSKLAGRDIPVISTEQYVGVRGTPVYNSDVEYFRYSSWDTEWECAKVTAENLAHHAAAEVPMVAFLPTYMIDGFGPEAAPYHNLGVVNAATHVYAHAGKGKPLDGVPENVRAFYFPDAKPQPFAVLYSLPMETDGRVLFHDPVRVLDVMGNEVQQGEDGLPLAMPLYVYFPEGGGEKALEKADWLNLGNPMKVSILSDTTIDVQIANLSLQPQPLKLEMKRFPEGWKWKQGAFSATLAPREKQTFRFELEEGRLQTMKRYDLGLKLQMDDAFVVEPIRFAALFVPYRENLDLADAEWSPVENQAVNHAKDPELDNKGPADLAAKFATAWNEKGFKLAVRVQDDQLVLGNQSLNSYQNDSVQVYFDMKRDATEMSDARKQNNADDVDWLVYSDGQEGFAYLIRNETGRHIGEANATTGIDPDVKVAFRKLADNEVEYEVFFPKEALPMIRFDPGARFGFSLLVNDNDGKGRKAGLTLAPAGTEPIFHAASYLDMILKK